MTSWIKRRLSGYDDAGRFWFLVGMVILVVDVAIAYNGGSSTTFWHGAGFAAVALAFAFLPDAAYEELEHGRGISAAVLGLATVLVGMQAFQNHITYTGGVRTGDIQQSGLSKAVYADTRQTIGDNQKLYEIMVKQLADLEAAAPWAASVAPDGLKAELATLRDRMGKEQQGQRGRKAGKGQEYERLENQANALAARIATAEKHNDLVKQIEVMKRAIETARGQADTKRPPSSVVHNVAQINAQLLNLATGRLGKAALDVNEDDVTVANLAGAGLNSLALMLLAPMCFFLAGRRRIKEAVSRTDSEIKDRLGTVVAPAVQVIKETDHRFDQLMADVRAKAA